MKILLIFIFLYPVKFQIKAKNAKKVLLAGEFTDWDKNPMPMEKKGDIWEITVDLLPGRYEYKFIVDGQWVSDPENPVKVPPYGNSVIEITEKGEKRIPRPLSNTRWNSSVLFSGDVRFYLNIEDTLKKYNTLSDAKIDLKSTLSGNSFLWIRLRYTNENLLSDGAIPVILERGEFSIREKNIIFRGFYNKFVLSSFEPFDLIGRIGEFQKDFGREEEGFIFNFFQKNFNFLFLYSNGWQEGRDLMFTRINFKGLAFNYEFKKGFKRSYSVYSPDSLKENGELIKFNSFNKEFFYSFDFDKKISKFNLKFAFGLGSLYWETDQKSTGESFEHSLKIYDSKRLFMGLGYLSGFNLSLFFENETQKLKEYFGNYSQSLSILGLSYKKGNLKLNLKNYLFSAPPDKFKNLFYFSRLNKLLYFETFSLGFKNLFSFILDYKFFNLPIYFTFRFSSPSPFFEPVFYESILKTEFAIFGSYEIYGNLRYVILNAYHLNAKGSYFSPYIELRKYIWGGSFVFVSFGLDPYTLDEDEWNRRLYLSEKGADIDLIPESYLRYGRASEIAERKLAELILLRIGAEVKF